jgi:hypothetical protein
MSLVLSIIIVVIICFVVMLLFTISKNNESKATSALYENKYGATDQEYKNKIIRSILLFFNNNSNVTYSDYLKMMINSGNVYTSLLERKVFQNFVSLHNDNLLNVTTINQEIN